MPRHIIYIINPISGTRTKKDLQEFIEKETRRKKTDFEIFPSVASGDYSFLLPLIKAKKTTDIVVAGGDGTVSQVVSGLMDVGCNFGIIPCGSGNGLALTAKIPRSPEKALDIVFRGRSASTDGFYVNKKFAVHLCGLGFDAKVAHDFARQPRRGLSTYIRQVVKNFFSAKTYPFVLQADGHELRTDAFFVSIANSNQFGNNFTIAPKASLDDGLLDIVISGHQNKLSLLYQTLQQVMGNNPLHEGIPETQKGLIYFQAKKLTISNPGKAPLHIDGDPAETAKKLEIAVHSKCFRLLQP